MRLQARRVTTEQSDGFVAAARPACATDAYCSCDGRTFQQLLTEEGGHSALQFHAMFVPSRRSAHSLQVSLFKLKSNFLWGLI